MKICLINNLYPPFNRGGAEVVVENQAKKLSKDGHDVFMITSKPLMVKARFEKDKFQIYRFFPLNLFSVYYIGKYPLIVRAIWRILDIFNFYTCWRVKCILKKERPDIVHTHNLTGLSYCIPKLIKKFGIEHHHTVHDVTLIHPSGLMMFHRDDPRQLSKFDQEYIQFTKKLFDSPTKVFFPSHWLKRLYMRYGFFKHSEIIVQRNYEQASKKLLPIEPKEKIAIIYVGQIEKHKGIFTLLDAVKNIDPEKFELKIIGTGSQSKHMKKLIEGKKHIDYLGWRSNDKTRELLENSDITIVPSLCYENSPTVIFESLRADTPVIASRIGGIPEIVAEGINGYLFEPGNVDELKIIILRLLGK